MIYFDKSMLRLSGKEIRVLKNILVKGNFNKCKGDSSIMNKKKIAVIVSVIIILVVVFFITRQITYNIGYRNGVIDKYIEWGYSKDEAEQMYKDYIKNE